MNTQQRTQLDTCNRIADFNAKYATQLIAIPKYTVELTAFKKALSAIHVATHVQSSMKESPSINVQYMPATDVLSTAIIHAFNAIDNMFSLVSNYYTGTNDTLVKEFATAKN